MFNSLTYPVIHELDGARLLIGFALRGAIGMDSFRLFFVSRWPLILRPTAESTSCLELLEY